MSSDIASGRWAKQCAATLHTRERLEQNWQVNRQRDMCVATTKTRYTRQASSERGRMYLWCLRAKRGGNGVRNTLTTTSVVPGPTNWRLVSHQRAVRGRPHMRNLPGHLPGTIWKPSLSRVASLQNVAARFYNRGLAAGSWSSLAAARSYRGPRAERRTFRSFVVPSPPHGPAEEPTRSSLRQEAALVC